jgi:hypothetical protein
MDNIGKKQTSREGQQLPLKVAADIDITLIKPWQPRRQRKDETNRQ